MVGEVPAVPAARGLQNGGQGGRALAAKNSLFRHPVQALQKPTEDRPIAGVVDTNSLYFLVEVLSRRRMINHSSYQLIVGLQIVFAVNSECRFGAFAETKSPK